MIQLRLTGINVTAWPDMDTRLKDVYFDWVKSWNMNVVVINFGWNFVEPQKGVYDQTYLAALDRLIVKIKAKGLYVVLRSHKWSNPWSYQGDHPAWPETWILGFPAWLGSTGSPPGSTAAPFWENYLDCQTAWVNMFAMLARRYAQESAVVGFTLIGEPGNDVGTFYGETDWYPWDSNAARKVCSVLFAPTRLYKRAIDVIHAEAPTVFVTFEGWTGYDWRIASVKGGSMDIWLEKPDCPNIVAAQSVYEWFQQNWFDENCAIVQAWGIPYQANECGANLSASGNLNPTPEKIAWLEGYLQHFATKNVGWMYWGLGPGPSADGFSAIIEGTDQVSPIVQTLAKYATGFPPQPQFMTLTVNSAIGGSTFPQPGDYNIITENTVQVAAYPDSGYQLVGWVLDGAPAGSANPVTIQMSQNHTLTPQFLGEPPPVAHSIIITASIGGTTNPVPARYDYTEGVSTVVTAIPDSGYRFLDWELDGTTRTENPTTVVMDTDYALRAVFEALPPPPPEKQYLTIVAINGQTNPAQGTYEEDKNASVTITATPNSGFQFKDWLVDNVQAGTSPFITVTMDTNHTVIAEFTQISPPPTQAGFPIWVIPVALLAGVGVLYLAKRKK